MPAHPSRRVDLPPASTGPATTTPLPSWTQMVSPLSAAPSSTPAPGWALAALMQDLDELSGRNARLDEWMSAELEKRASWDDDALAAATYLPDMLRIARERGLHVPPRLRDLQ